MTHDELLAKIDDWLAPPKSAGEWSMNEFAGKMLITLRAVVELHKPSPKDYKNEIGCVGCDVNSEWATWNEEWPCPTIQTIEKELA